MCGTLLARDTNLLIRCLQPLNFPVAVTILGLLTGQFADPLQEGSPRLVTLPILAVYLSVMATPWMVHSLCFTRHYEASWALRTAPLAGGAGVARGAFKALMAYIMMPFCVLLGAVMSFSWGDVVSGMLHACLALALSWPVGLAAIRLVVPDVPFSLPYSRGSVMGPVVLPLAILSAPIGFVAGLHFLCGGSAYFWITAPVVVLAASWRLGKPT